jgi:D-alanyl-D-alanine carboxypeptidase (penicillin-binding protein 5/6)
MTRSLRIVLLASLLLPLSALAVPGPPDLDATAFAVLDFNSGTLLAARNADEHLAPASITKVMTVYVAFDQIKKGQLHLTDQVQVSEHAWKRGDESRMFLQVGTKVSVDDLLKGIIIQSGNDAAVALAEHIAGSESVFADLMNEYAQRLGLKDTHFMNPTGLSDPNHYTSAHDLVFLARALIRDFPQQYKIFSQHDFLFNNIKQGNRNLLLYEDSSVDGIKTGFTDEAGYCLLASAVRDGHRLITAVLHTKSTRARARDSMQLLGYGFAFFESDALLGPGAPVMSVPTLKGDGTALPLGSVQPVYLALPKGSRAHLKFKPVVTTPRLVAPIAAGQTVGQIQILLDDKPLEQVPLQALRAQPTGGIWRRMIDQIRIWSGG